MADPREVGRTLAKVEQSLVEGASSVSAGIVTSLNLSAREATVNLSGGSQVMRWIGESPWVGDTVRVITLGAEPVCIPVYGAAMGTVQVVASGIATVLGDDTKTYSYPYPNGASLSNGHRVVLDHAHRAVAMRVSTEPPGSTFVPPQAPPSSGIQDRWFYPIDSGNYRGGSYQGLSVDISDTRSGFFWLGHQIADSIPDSATILLADLVLAEDYDNVPGTASRLGTHTQDGMHGGSPPALSGALNVFGGTVDIRGTYADALKNGTAFGFGFPAGYGYRSFGTKAYSGGVHIIWS